MIKQDFYIANLIARYLSEEITPEETIKQRAITPGQAVVLYDGEYVLGGGTIIADK